MRKYEQEPGMYGDIKLFGGTACPDFAQKVSDSLQIPLSGHNVTHFPNDNLWVQLQGSVRGQDVYVIQTTSRPVHRNLMELLITLQTLRLDSAGRVTAVVPYLAYARFQPWAAKAFYESGRTLESMGEVASARRTYEAFLDGGDAPHEIGALARERLKQLPAPSGATKDSQ